MHLFWFWLVVALVIVAFVVSSSGTRTDAKLCPACGYPPHKRNVIEQGCWECRELFDEKPPRD